MKPLSQLLFLGAVAFSFSAAAQTFTSGSTGSAGPLIVTVNTNIVLPPNGILNYTTVNIAPNRTVTFMRNEANTPVYILATGNVTIAGPIILGRSNGNNVKGGEGGPGGFDGGSPGSVSIPSGAGYGPGSGRGGLNNNTADGAGGGAFATAGGGGSTRKGASYGNALLIPMIGGSGGGGTDGTPGRGGAGGGGAILIASTTRIDLTADISAEGGGSVSSAQNGGSGGAVRLVAPVVAGGGRIFVRGSGGGGLGRIRIDATDRSQMNIVFYNPEVTSVGSLLLVFPNPLPRLDIIEAAGKVIPEGSGSQTLQLPFGSSPNRTVRIQARDFNAQVPITLVLTPDHGTPITYTSTIRNTAGNNPATVDVNIVMPINEQTTFHVYSK